MLVMIMMLPRLGRSDSRRPAAAAICAGETSLGLRWPMARGSTPTALILARRRGGLAQALLPLPSLVPRFHGALPCFWQSGRPAARTAVALCRGRVAVELRRREVGGLQRGADFKGTWASWTHWTWAT
jgi:hypothetical protein